MLVGFNMDLMFTFYNLYQKTYQAGDYLIPRFTGEETGTWIR